MKPISWWSLAGVAAICAAATAPAVAVVPAAIAAGSVHTTPAAPGAAEFQGSIIYLVRHAETTGEQAMDPRDPPLSEAGRARAAALARTLADAGLTSIHSTDLERTRSTAAAVAATTGLEVALYDPFDQAALTALLERLQGDGGRHLIVGHSNTTPALVEALGGDPVSEIPETEYDRLYVVSVSAGGEVVSTLLRYGASSGQ